MFGRFEAADPNELWVGDALHGPRVGDRKTYLFAFLDDHSRLVTGYRFGFAEDTVRLAAALRPALAARGVPAGIYVDNGSAFVMRGCCGRARNSGSAWCIRHPADRRAGARSNGSSAPCANSSSSRSPTPASEDLAAAGVDHATALLELNRLFVAWVETEYHRRIHTETGQTPAGPVGGRLGPARPHPGDADRRRSDRGVPVVGYRVVTKTATVSLHANTYQVDPGPGRAQGGTGVLTRSTWKPSRSATATRVSAQRCRTPSPATPTRKPDPKHPTPSRRRRRGSTTWR